MSARAVLCKFISIIIITYALFLVALYFQEPHLLFHPSPVTGPPEQYGIKNFKPITITTSDNVKLTAWFHQGTPGNHALVYFYGNADSLASYKVFFNKLAKHGFTVLGMNYRGYGGSEGVPSEEGLYNDARAAINYLKVITPENNIIACGRSLGTGIAVEMGTEFNLNSIILISPYTSIPDVAAGLYPYLPVHLISRYEFASLKKIPNLKEPLMIIHGKNDALISPDQGKTLFAAAKTRKTLNVYADSDHLKISMAQVADDIFRFTEAPHAD